MVQLIVSAGSTQLVEAQAGYTVKDLKQHIQEQQGIPQDALRIQLAGKDLLDSLDLGQCEDNSYLEVLGRLLGGGKKKKKKTYTKPKKIKHKHRKENLRILRCYKVDDDGTVIRLRKVCPSPQCGPGIFMANHPDRVYCGKCALTYKQSRKA